MNAYRIYTKRNLAETSRDPDDIQYKELGYRLSLDSAKSLANEYIKNNFLQKNIKLTKNDREEYTAINYCSWGEIIIIEPIIISE